MSRMPIVSAVSALGLVLAPAAHADARGDFVVKAMQGDNSESMLGRYAEQHASSRAVRAYGRMLFADHSKGKVEAVTLARSMGVRPTNEPMDEAKHERQKLSGLRGPAFDREFVRYMIDDHQHDIADFRKEAEIRDGRVSAFAEKTLPVLHKHLDTALKLSRAGGPG